MKKEEMMLVSRAAEQFEQAEYAVTVSDFLSPGEKQLVYKELIARFGSGISRCFFWGGCRGAERCTAVFLPEWYCPADAPRHSMVLDTERTDAFAAHLAAFPDLLAEIPVGAVRICGSGFRTLTHRDFMGSVLSLGLERAVVGDIAVLNEAEALVFVRTHMIPFICENLTKIGRDAVKTVPASVEPLYEIPRRYEESTILVSSPRLDGVVKAITGKSREAAAEMVRAGLTDLSYTTVCDVAADVREGDILSIRGFGKYVIGPAAGQSRSGRIRLSIKKYS